MALVRCRECSAEISDRAAACPRCGAPAQGAANALPVTVRKEPSSKLWIWVIAGLVAAFLGFGALQPESARRANEFARACKQVAGLDPVAQLECNKAESSIRSGGADPTVNSSFVAEPPQPPSSMSNEEIMRRAMYPDLYKDEKPAKHSSRTPH